MKLGEAMYAQAQGDKPADTSESATGADGKKEDVVDAEFTEVDDKNDKKSA
jgi:molecular chaperone DnaK